MSAISIAREYFPDLSDHDLETVIWELTGFPHFWHIPEHGATPLECFRHQLAQVASRLSEGVSINQQQAEVWQ